MQEPMRVAVKFVLAVFAATVAALVLAAVAVRFPVVWPLFPEWIFKFLLSGVNPNGQEAVANVEFLGFWLVCFAAVTLCAVVPWALARRRANGQRNEHG